MIKVLSQSQRQQEVCWLQCEEKWSKPQSQQHISPIGFLFWNFRHRLVRYYWYSMANRPYWFTRTPNPNLSFGSCAIYFDGKVPLSFGDRHADELLHDRILWCTFIQLSDSVLVQAFSTSPASRWSYLRKIPEVEFTTLKNYMRLPNGWSIFLAARFWHFLYHIFLSILSFIHLHLCTS